VTLTWWPARVSCLTNAEPMLPAPMTVIFMFSPFQVLGRAGTRFGGSSAELLATD
jgi:hypothetical protein